jgi:hypothetical protein
MKRLISLSMVFMTCLIVTVAHADIYVSSSGSGSQDGTTCANARSAAWFNAAGNWGGGGTNIDPGDTVRLCGTFTGAANSTILTIRGSGTSGNVITILFEANAKLQAPYFPYTGAIDIENRDYIKIDGGTNGIIQATDNGSIASGKTYHENSNDTTATSGSQGIFVSGSNNIEICNLSIKNIFINTGGDSPIATDITGRGTKNIYLSERGGVYHDILIHDNTLTNARVGVQVGFAGANGVTGVKIYNNKFSDHCWMIGVGAGSSGSVLTDIDIYNNEMTDWNLWQYPASAYHTDGLIIYSNTGSGTSSYTGSFRDNYVHGDLGSGSASGYLGVGCGGNGFKIYNNLFVCEDGSVACSPVYLGGTTGCTAGQPVNTKFYNNTCIGNTYQKERTIGFAIKQSRGAAEGGSYMIVKNNIFKTWNHPLSDANSDFSAFSGSGSADYNLYYDLYYYSANSGYRLISGGEGGNYKIMPSASVPNLSSSTFYSHLGQENHGLYADPSLDALYKPRDGSPAIGAGVDLSGIFTTDKDNKIRSVPWDIGAKKRAGTTGPRNLRDGSVHK